jgi:hypothetical protein
MAKEKLLIRFGTWITKWTGKGATGNTMKEISTKTVTKVLTWGNATKVAIVGVGGWLLLSGGLSSMIAGALGVPEWFAQILIYLGIFVVIIWIINYIRNWIKRGTRSISYRTNRRY